MNLSSMVKQMGEAEGESRIYVEDYVNSYLKDLKNRKDEMPLKAALYGYTYSKEGKHFYFIYGAACVTDEIKKGREEKQLNRLFFPDYELIGYVKIGKDLEGQAQGNKNYYIFYDSNEAMQNYLISYFGRDEAENVTLKEKEELQAVWKTNKHGVVPQTSDLIQKICCFLLLILLAIAVTTLDEYQEMYGFAEASERAIRISDIQD